MNFLEDGHYVCQCIRCDNRFFGPKHALVCKQCKRKESEEWEALSQEEKDRIIDEREQSLIEWSNNFQFPEDV